MTRKLRVLILIPHLGGGGAEKVTALLARGLSGEKYEVHLGLVTRQAAEADPLPDQVPNRVTVHRLGARRVRAGAFALLRLVRQLRPDVILSGMAHLNFLVLLLRPLFPPDTRVLVRQNGTVSSALAFGGLPWYSRQLYRLLYPRADRILCPSRAMADDLAAELQISKDRIVVLPNPVDFEGIRAAARNATMWTGRGPRLLAVGRLSPEKGFDLLLEAFARVRAQHPDAELILLGSGPEEARLKALCRTLRLETAVRFAGNVQRPYDYFAGAPLFVLPSRHEGLPNALLEAAVAGLPIVATPASGGVVDLLRTLEGAWLARESSAAAIAETLLEALGTLGPGQRFARSFPSARRSEDKESSWSEEFAFESAIAAYERLIDSICLQPETRHTALVIPTLDRIGGAERHVMQLAHGLHNRGWRVSVVALAGSGGVAAGTLAAEGITFLSLGMRKGLVDPRGWLRLFRWLRRERPAVVHAHLPHAAWLARWSRLCAPIPVLIDTLHSTSTGTAGRRLGYWLSRWLPDRVTAVSRSVADAHLAAGMVSRSGLTIVPNGVDVDEWRPDELVRAATRNELSLQGEFLWMAVGRLENVKDYPTLLRAMAALGPRTQLVIAGAGPLQDELVSLARELGLGSQVRFLGFVPDMRRWLQCADGFVLSSRWEGLPMALLEASACGLPTLATDVPGSLDVVLDGVTGFLVPPGNSAALADAMGALMRTPDEERRAMGLQARQHAAQNFSLTTTIGRYEELYRDLLQAKLRPSIGRQTTARDSPRPSASQSGDAF